MWTSLTDAARSGGATLEDWDWDFVSLMDEHGWAVTHVAPTEAEADEMAPWAYSSGFLERFNHPEFVVCGLSQEIRHWLVNELGRRIQGGAAYAPGDDVDELLEGDYICQVRSIDPRHYPEHFGRGQRLSSVFGIANAYTVLQLVWPNKSGKYPDQVEDEASFRSYQPILDGSPLNGSLHHF